MVKFSPCGPWTTNVCAFASTLTTRNTARRCNRQDRIVDCAYVKRGVHSSRKVAVTVHGKGFTQIEIDAQPAGESA